MHLNSLSIYLAFYCVTSYIILPVAGLTNTIRFTKKRLNQPPYEVSLGEIILTFLNLFCISEPKPCRTEDILPLIFVYMFSPISLTISILILIVEFSPEITSKLIKKFSEIKLENKDAKFIEELKK